VVIFGLANIKYFSLFFLLPLLKGEACSICSYVLLAKLVGDLRQRKKEKLKKIADARLGKGTYRLKAEGEKQNAECPKLKLMAERLRKVCGLYGDNALARLMLVVGR
jgi:hypothetical protein